MNKKISTTVGVLIIILSIIIFGGGILAYQYLWQISQQETNIMIKNEQNPSEQKPETKTPEKTQNEIANWQTYRNEEYGFEFKVAPLFVKNGYKIIIWPKEDVTTESLDILIFQIKAIPPYPFPLANPEEYNTMFSIVINSQDYCTQQEGKKYDKASCDYKYADQCKCIRNGNQYFSHFLLENNKYFIYYGTGPSSGDVANAMGWDKPEVKNVFNQMLSTFKFLDKCGECPQYMPNHPDFCKDGIIIPPQQDECGCWGPPGCKR